MMKSNKLIIYILIALMAIAGGIGLYYQRFIFEMKGIPVQTTVAYIFGGICSIALGFAVSDKKKTLKKLLIVFGILDIVMQIVFTAVL